MIVKKKVEVEVEVSVNFEEACHIVLKEMDNLHCEAFEQIIDKVLQMDLTYRNISIVDLMKDEVLSKIKEEFTLEKIEEIYESLRQSNSVFAKRK